jgi:general secretion pathway protein D
MLVAAIFAGPVQSLRGQERRVPELRPLNTDPITLRVIGQSPRTIYETLAKLTGIDILWDPTATAQAETGRFTVEFSNATLREALDKVASVTKTSWKPTSDTTVTVGLP